MRRTSFVLISVLVLSCCLLGISQAATLLDTGPGPSSGDFWPLDSVHRGTAGKFTTSQGWIINSVETWIQVEGGGTAVAVIYNNDGDGTVPGTKRFSQDITPTASPGSSWQGATGLNWSLPAGTFWLGFEVNTPGFQSILYYPAASPLRAYASAYIEGPWQSSNLPVGFRIQGNMVQSKSSLAGINALLLD